MIGNFGFYNRFRPLKEIIEGTVKNVCIPEVQILSHYIASRFSYFSYLETLDLPNASSISVTRDSRGRSVYVHFSYYNQLKQLKLSSTFSSITPSLFYQCQNLEIVDYPGVQELSTDPASRYAFYGCPNIKYLRLGLSKIYSSVFSNWRNLEEIYFSNTVVVHSSAFARCSKLSYAEFHNLGFVGSGAFAGCSNLKSIHIDRGITSITELMSSSPSSVYFYTNTMYQYYTNYGSPKFYAGLISPSNSTYYTTYLRFVWWPSSFSSSAEFRWSYYRYSVSDSPAIIFTDAFEDCVNLTDIYMKNLPFLVPLSFSISTNTSLSPYEIQFGPIFNNSPFGLTSTQSFKLGTVAAVSGLVSFNPTVAWNSGVKTATSVTPKIHVTSETYSRFLEGHPSDITYTVPYRLDYSSNFNLVTLLSSYVHSDYT